MIRIQRVYQWLVQGSHTSYVWLFVSIITLVFLLKDEKWNSNRVFTSDPAGYYMYLPSGLLLDDLGDGSWTSAARREYRPNVDPQWEFVPLPNGRKVFKFPMGMAVAYSPFFFTANIAYKLEGRPVTNGYERAYQYLISVGCMLYVLLGLWLLGKELRRYFDDHVAAFTLLIIGLGTNLLTYATAEGLMAHGTLFMLNVLLLRATRRWYERPSAAVAAGLGLLGGLMLLIRPSELMLLVGVPVFWGLTSWGALQERLRFWRQHWGQCLLAAGLALLVSGMQFVFWRVVGLQWLVPFYPGETFHFDDPHILLGFFSFRKGWLIYSPLFVLSFIGIVWVRRWAPKALPLLLGLVPIYTYVTFCWHQWEYGGSYGGRPMISLYPILAFGMAAFWQRWLAREARLGWRPAPLVLLAGGLLIVGLIQNYQYTIGLINCCEMDWETYRKYFLLLQWPS
ncbi:hypothetical protein [Hymenobacter metallilatus]|uniref:Glycosyltransferase RgtA/B/C/D-like domain-containing protein n=1 Tax=Hymenobacter metallilatus TaxID=2493666 RepID=A0A3R9NLA6_9BACT|nr:hypothetical protein [Hymenobacter metallilatus]RSK31156.1 hypothetical protein EI290_14135 [Hymenobacter metallilatus]